LDRQRLARWQNAKKKSGHAAERRRKTKREAEHRSGAAVSAAISVVRQLFAIDTFRSFSRKDTVWISEYVSSVSIRG
jgi:hypothetical protein